MCNAKIRVRGLLEACVSEIGKAMQVVSGLDQPSGFLNGMEGFILLRASSMSIQYVTENIKKIDNLTGGKLFSKYPGVGWKSVKGMRDVLSTTVCMTLYFKV